MICISIFVIMEIPRSFRQQASQENVARGSKDGVLDSTEETKRGEEAGGAWKLPADL